MLAPFSDAVQRFFIRSVYVARMRRLLILCPLFYVAACTPGSFATVGGGGSDGTTFANVKSIDVDLTKDPAGTTPAGTAAGFSPVTTSAAVGDGIRFTNSDGFAHTATSISGATFPSAYPFDGSALTGRGSTLSGGFSSGSLAAGATSQTLLADRAGSYLFGCFYHYGSPMRAEIVVH